ncbi:2Fe-2S iron-sulfur cluster-binding protein [Saccharospirillum sp. HFRX-1]|uniref:2Fe-2S iron-sulfur cluster-binding protein n=1 Tax=unclassified Saccharospirillum TaxID=2633430 RepID=UPI00371E8D2F
MSYRITLEETDESFTVADDEPILDAAERAGINLAHDCRYGGCSTCRFKLLSGEVGYEEMPFALTEAEAEAGYGLACQARAKSDLHISATIRPEGFIQPDYHEAIIEQLELLCHDVVHLVLRIPSAAEVIFHPGQYLNVMLDDGEPRSFSMASPPGSELFDLHVRRVPGGRFTDTLIEHYKVGDTLDVELPLGDFRLQSDDISRPILLVASGTGLAPIKSIIESLCDNALRPPMTLYWGVRSEQDLYLNQQLTQWVEQLDDFDYAPVLSRPDSNWQGRSGYVQDAVVADFADLSGFDAYLCGSPTMVKAARDLFVRHGMPIERIYSDAFNFSHELTGESVETA